MSEVNIPLLRKAVEWAEAEANRPATEREWHQGAWQMYRSDDVYSARYDERGNYIGEALDREKAASCGTAYCIAGHVAAEVNPEVYQLTMAGHSWDFETNDYARDEDGNLLPHASKVAQEALGLTDSQADNLFSGMNTIHDVRRIAEGIAGERL